MTNEAVKVIRVEWTGGREYIAYYVTITRDYSFEECKMKLKVEHGITVNFMNLKYDFDTCVELLYAAQEV